MGIIIITGFDNDQFIGKTYTVQQDNKMKSSLITTCAYIQLDATVELQANY